MPMQYEFRPAKAAQRRMIVDACRRLTAITELANYQYVGFGGLEFIDFIEFHRGLGLLTMTSIEKDTNMQHRLEFNKPYKSIEVLIGEARDRLPDIDWKMLAIVWLDYTDLLNMNILRDIDYVIRSCVPGSLLIVTVNGASTGIPLGERFSKLSEKLGDLVASSLRDVILKDWMPAREQRRILQETSNSLAREVHRGSLRQLFNFEYQDDAKMLTWGGIVCSPSVDRVIDLCRFSDLTFIRSDEKPFEIKVPFFTEREMTFLELEIGGSRGDRPSLKGVENKDIRSFAEMYRWRVGMR